MSRIRNRLDSDWAFLVEQWKDQQRTLRQRFSPASTPRLRYPA
jgi:hypothetical protein